MTTRADHRLTIEVDTYIECYHAQGDKTPRHYDSTQGQYVSDNGAMEATLRNLMLAAPQAYQRRIILRTIWSQLDADTRTYILRDIDHEQHAYQPAGDMLGSLVIDASCDGYAED